MPFLLLATAISLAATQTASSPPGPTAWTAELLIVMTPTGDVRDGLPVHTRHPNASSHHAVLTRGFSGRLLRLFRWEQQFLARRDGTPIEPAYLLLSATRGGFPRFGFWLDGANKAGVGYVDLHERQRLDGQFGAMDQIFPHELLHVIARQLAGAAPRGPANQMHAIGVRTDRQTAFAEGFAEHAQVMAVDDPDAMLSTRALAHNADPPAMAAWRLTQYQRALEARWSIAPPAQMGFPFWFSQAEQAIRYHDVKANAFAGEPVIAARLLSRRHIYRAYLLENILPGAAGAAVKSTPRLLATEGVVAALFARWMRDPVLRQPVKSEAFYERFDTTSSQVMSIEHAYLKLFAAVAERRTHDTASLVRSYAEMFPDEAAAVAGVVRDAGLTWPLPDAPEIWLASDQFMTGTSLFDQFRAAPRVHTFDLNAASLVDLLTVDGVTPDLARAIQQGAPYALVSDVGVVPGVTAAVVDRLSHMHDEMKRLREANAGEDDESMNLMQILTPLLIRATLWILIAAAVAGWLYGRVRQIRPLRLAVNGFAAAALGLLAAWTLGAALQYGSGGIEPAVLAFLPVLIFAVPGALWQLARGRSVGEAARVVAAWTVACVPAVAMTQPLF